MKRWIENWWLRRLQPQPAYAIDSQRRIGVLPTGFGWALLLWLLLLFIWAGNHRLNLGYALIFMVLTLFLYSAVQAVWHLRGMQLQARGGEGVFAGQEALFYVDVRHPQARYGLQLESPSEEIPFALEAATEKRLLLRQPTQRRGRLRLAPLRLACLYPFGFFRAWYDLKFSAEVWVDPRPEGDLPLPWTASASSGAGQREYAGEEELSSLRPYVVGDYLSRIAWKQSSRGTLLLKQFSAQGAQRLHLAWAETRGGTEQRLSQLAQWIEQAEAEALPYALELPGQRLDWGRGEAHRRRCLQLLAAYEGE